MQPSPSEKKKPLFFSVKFFFWIYSQEVPAAKQELAAVCRTLKISVLNSNLLAP